MLLGFGKHPPEESCLVLGSGTVMDRYKIGELINRFKYVIRVGKSAIEGYEGRVGTKTTHMLVDGVEHPSSFAKKVKLATQDPNIKTEEITLIVRKERFDMFKQAKGISSCFKELVEETCESVNITAGARAIEHAQRTYGFVYIHGFDHAQGVQSRQHYYSVVEGIHKSMDLNKEANDYIDAVEEGKLGILTDYIQKEKYRTCPSSSLPFFAKNLPENSCCVIGSGTVVTDHELGHLIDKFKYVARFINGSIVKYEKHAGSKTTHMYANTTWTTLPLLEEHIREGVDFSKIQLILKPGFFNMRRWIEERKVIEEVLDVDLKLEPFETDWNRKTLPRITHKNPTSGYKLICYFLSRDIPVYAHGYNFAQGSKKKGHYYGGNVKVLDMYHNIGLEGKNILRAVHNGKIALLTDYDLYLRGEKGE